MATFNWPAAVRPSTLEWHLRYNSQAFSSPLSRVVQTAELPGAVWIATMRLDQLKRSEIAPLEALIFKLRGMANRVLVPDHFRSNPRGAAGGLPLVLGAGQSGTSITTDGWTGPQAGCLLEGDRININGEFKAITADTSSDAGGVATLQFEPPLRASPPDNAPITFTDATCKMMLLDDNQGRLSTRKSLTGTTLTFVEAIF